MPRKPKIIKPYPKHYQAGRTHLRRSITLSPRALEAHAEIAIARPDLMYLSTAIDHALVMLQKSITEENRKRKS
jgi:hypothetical protein